jgi:hypothetical protein
MNISTLVKDYWFPTGSSIRSSISRRRKICKIFNKDYKKEYTVPVGGLSSAKASKILKDLIDSYKQ